MTRRSVPLARLAREPGEGGGLTAAQVRERRERFGPNDIVEVPPGRWRRLALDTARDPMLWFLAALGVVYWLVGEAREAITLLAAILPLAGVDAVLHWRTQASTEGLRGRLAERATVVRDGVAAECPAEEIVPGDLVLVGPGEAFPADGLLVGGAELQVDESTLTGESQPARKRVLPGLPGDGPEPLVDVVHWGLAGTRLLTGHAALRVVHTGGETLYGEIVRSAVSGTRERTPLQASIQGLVGVLLAVAATVCAVLALVRLRQGYGWLDAVVSAVALATAALPEEFPVVFTCFLGVGVYRLARRQALVRRAVSVENIGRVSCICADKTGTMTEGRLRLTHALPAEGVEPVRLLGLAALASREDSGDPLDAAVLHEARAAGVPAERALPLATFPFTEARRRETAIVRERGGALVAATKGAAETVLELCTLAAAEREAWTARMVALAGEGHKVIAVAWRPLDETEWSGTELARGFRLAGLLALEDPLREGVAPAIRRCREAGIHTVMVTGDHAATALAVARALGLGGPAPVVVAGDELEARLAQGATAELRRLDVIARAAPAQKFALVRALQEAGEVVAVTGDGVNDVPALQAADVGIAMGERGTRSAREVAAIVLLDDNFRTIVDAVGEGRQLLENLRLSFAYLLAVHVPLVVTALLVPLAGYPLLYLPVHIVWLELIVHPTALLAFQAPAPPAPAPRRAGRTTRVFRPREWLAIAATGLVLAAVVVRGYLGSVEAGGGVEHGRAMALAALVTGSAAITVVLGRLRTRLARAVVTVALLGSVAMVQTPGLAARLHVAPLRLDEWLVAAAGGLLAALPTVLLTARRPGPP